MSAIRLEPVWVALGYQTGLGDERHRRGASIHERRRRRDVVERRRDFGTDVPRELGKQQLDGALRAGELGHARCGAGHAAGSPPRRAAPMVSPAASRRAKSAIRGSASRMPVTLTSVGTM